MGYDCEVLQACHVTGRQTHYSACNMTITSVQYTVHPASRPASYSRSTSPTDPPRDGGKGPETETRAQRAAQLSRQPDAPHYSSKYQQQQSIYLPPANWHRDPPSPTSAKPLSYPSRATAAAAADYVSQHQHQPRRSVLAVRYVSLSVGPSQFNSTPEPPAGGG